MRDKINSGLSDNDIFLFEFEVNVYIWYMYERDMGVINFLTFIYQKRKMGKRRSTDCKMKQLKFKLCY